MTTREALKQQLDICTEEQLQQIADFMELLKLRAQTSDASHDTPKAQVLEDFRQAWHEAMTGQGIPISQLWQELLHLEPYDHPRTNLRTCQIPSSRAS
jgi:hypothetical protein